ncbi:MAG: alpha-glucuronidase family glycosyl hydrolase, partial [Pirellulales bacterium]
MLEKLSIALCLIGLSTGSASARTVRIVIDADAAPRVAFGVDRLVGALREIGHDATVVRSPSDSSDDMDCIAVGWMEQPHIRSLINSGRVQPEPNGLGDEGFLLASCGRGTLAVIAGDDSGALYGCLELARRIQETGQLPVNLHFSDHPAFKLRGTCIAMQKTYILPGRQEYEYPYTPELFPFFYDKAFWTEYLDSLAEKRMNMLCLWNGHPFASLVKLPEYPYALEVSENQFERNVVMYRYIAEEADKRGIWLVQMFYSILLSQPLAARHGLDTQLSAPTPLAADYTRKSIAEFVRQYPNVGLYVCLGEAMLDVEKQ